MYKRDCSECFPKVSIVNFSVFAFHSEFIFRSIHISLSSDTQAYCPEGYVLRNRRCFRVHVNELSFQEAENECNTLPGGHLATFRNNLEQQFLQALR